jgi:hypothetical protein
MGLHRADPCRQTDHRSGPVKQWGARVITLAPHFRVRRYAVSVPSSVSSESLTSTRTSSLSMNSSGEQSMPGADATIAYAKMLGQ